LNTLVSIEVVTLPIDCHVLRGLINGSGIASSRNGTGATDDLTAIGASNG